MAPNDTTPTDATDEGATTRGDSDTTPYAVERVPDGAADAAAPAPRKRATRRTAKKAAPAPESAAAADAGAATGSAPDSDATAEAAPAPARKRAARKTAAPRKRAPKKAVVETLDVLESVALTEAGAGAEPETGSGTGLETQTETGLETGTEAGPETGRATQRGRRSRKVAPGGASSTPGPIEQPEPGVGDLAEDHADDLTEAPDEAEDEAADAATEAGAAARAIPTFDVLFQAPDPEAALAAPTRRRRRAQAPVTEVAPQVEAPEDQAAGSAEATEAEGGEPGDDDATPRRSRRRRGGKGRRGRGGPDGDESESESPDDEDEPTAQPSEAAKAEESETAGAEEGAGDEEGVSTRRRRRRRRAGAADGDAGEEAPNVSTRVRQPRAQSDEPLGVKGSTRLEAKKQRRREGREAGRRRTIITEAEFLARREAVDRVMVVRNKEGRTQMGVLEDGVLVEHYIDQATHVSMAGNIYLGRVQNVLPSMEAAFVDIGKGRNAVLYAGEVNWDVAGLDTNQPKRIENALTSGQTVLVQVTKDPIGHKGARLTSQISLPGRYLVYVPNSSMTGISRKLPDTERARLKKILRDVVPESAGVIVRTAAEGATEEELRADVERLSTTWEDIQARAEAASTAKAGKSKGKKKNGGSGSSTTGSAPMLLHGEPDLTVRVIRDVFNEDFKKLIVSGEQAWNEIHPYISSVAPDLADRVTKWTSDEDLFAHHRVDEQLAKAMDRKVWLPSGGSLVIDRTEAMTVVDVNTGKFVGSGGNLEETVTKNNLEAAEEIVRQLRLRDIGGIIVIDFIDMVLESNRDLVVRRLLECLGRDRTKHQVAEVTSLGLVQMTRKRVGSGLIEVFSETCEHCNGRGFIIHSDPVDKGASAPDTEQGGARSGRRGRRGATGGQSATGNGAAPQPDQARPSGPTAAQIAAAAHAAALKSAGGTSGPESDGEPAAEGEVRQVLPEDAGPWEGQDEQAAGQPPATGAEGAEPESEAAVPADQPASDEDPSLADTSPADASPADASPADASREEAGEPVATLVAEEAPEPAEQPTAQRGRRRRGRVVAPAGPPRTSSTGA